MVHNPLILHSKKKNQTETNQPNDILHFEIFKSLSPLGASIIERNVYRRRFRAGELIVNKGDAAIGLYLVHSGEVKVYNTVKGRQIELAKMSGGSFFGELTLLKARQRTASVIATEHTEVFSLFRPDFLDILNNYPAICTKFLPNFSENILNRICHMYEEIRKIQ